MVKKDQDKDEKELNDEEDEMNSGPFAKYPK